MKDVLLKFGNISAATKQTEAYAADIIDMGAVRKAGQGDQVNVVFVPATDMASADTIVCKLLECATVNGTYTACAAGAAVTLKAGEKFALPVPRTHKRFLKAGVYPDSSSTFTATTIAAQIEIGA